jgi:hypothetical protein
MEKITWIYHVRNEETLPKVCEKRKIRQTMKRRNTNFSVYICRSDCFLKHIIEEKARDYKSDRKKTKKT